MQPLKLGFSSFNIWSSYDASRKSFYIHETKQRQQVVESPVTVNLKKNPGWNISLIYLILMKIMGGKK